MIEIKTEITDKGRTKLYKKAYNDVKSELIKEVGEEMFDYIMMGGLGSRKGRTPTGGSPVWETRPDNDPTDAVPMELLNSHKFSARSSMATISSSSPYVTDVIIGRRSGYWVAKYGTGAMSKPNPYHKRAVDMILKSKAISDNLKRSLVENGLK